MKQGEHFRTIDLARAVGLSAQQVRDYEASGLLPPAERSESGYRMYTERHMEALLTTRTMISGYGGQQQALDIMRAVHSGDLDIALALVDSRHADLDRRRAQIEKTLEAIRTLVGQPVAPATPRRTGGLRIGEAAKLVGVRPSALRFWEQQGLLQSARDESNRYRIYDEQEMQRLEVVALLRGADYGFDAIRAVLDELAAGKLESALRVGEKRREEISSASRACARATAALWNYAVETSTFH